MPKESNTFRLRRVKHQKQTEPDNLTLWLDIAGRRVGTGDWRPGNSGGDYGRFELEITRELEG